MQERFAETPHGSSCVHASEGERTEVTKRTTSKGTIVGRSRRLTALLQMVDRVARSDCSVLITGESGTGKGLLVAALHDASKRAAAPLISLNCAAMPHNLVESELFGHVRGAFTGAHATREGRVSQAEGGTLFLDEIGELPLALQPKLLRLLQEREYTPLGDGRTRKCNVRFVAATNQDLPQQVKEGGFREDLYFRLNVIELQVPPLRERPEDIEMLAKHCFDSFVGSAGRDDLEQIDEDAIRALASYDWPGNIRELENVIQRAVLLSPGPSIGQQDLPAAIEPAPPCSQAGALRYASEIPDAGINLRSVLSEYEDHLMQLALERTRWNKNRAARLLGLNRTTLVEMIKRKKLRRSA